MTLFSTIHTIMRQGPRNYGVRRPRRQRSTRSQAAVESLEGRAMLSHVTTEFPIQSPDGGGSPQILAMTTAPDGNLWFIDEISPGAQNAAQIGMMAQSGTITWYPPISNFGAGAYVNSGYITPGPGGSIWFGAGGDFGEITASGAMKLYPAPSIAPYISGLTAGPDGNIWFTASQNNYVSPVTSPSVVGRITPAGQITTYPVLPGPLGDQVTTSSIVQGKDGQLWFAALIPTGSDSSELEMASVTPAGQITLHPIEKAGSASGFTANWLGYDLTRGPDGNPWLLVGGLSNAQNTGFVKSEILRIEPSGKFKPFAIPLASNRQLGTVTSGPGDKLYFTIQSQSPNDDGGTEPTIGELSASGHVSFTSIPWRDVPPSGGYQEPMTVGPGDKLWFVGVGGEFGYPPIVRLNVFHPTKPGHDPFPPPPNTNGSL